MTKMNLKRLALVLLLALPLRMVIADDVPKPFSFARYQGMMDRSPFAVATALAPAAAPNFAKDLYVANAARSKEGDLVTIASSTDKNFKKYLTTNAPVDGYSISSIEWSDKVGATKVTIAKDGQSATLSFNEALLRQPAGPGQNPVPQPMKQDQNLPQTAAQPPAPVIPGAQPNAIKPMPVPALPTPPPRVRGVIPRNPTGNAVAPAPPQPGS
ncbi:MAG TPA: hypothetical protein VF345_11860 [Chthoniobacterales bacterium]